MSDHRERACPRCGSLLHYDCRDTENTSLPAMEAYATQRHAVFPVDAPPDWRDIARELAECLEVFDEGFPDYRWAKAVLERFRKADGK